MSIRLSPLLLRPFRRRILASFVTPPAVSCGSTRRAMGMNHILLPVRMMQTEAVPNHPLHASKERIRQDHGYCVDLVRDRDREGYLCGLLMPKASQNAFFAIKAMNVELAAIKDGSARLRGGAANSSLAVQLKFQRWRDVLQVIYESLSSTENTNDDDEEYLHSPTTLASFVSDPVVSALWRAVHEKQLTRRFCERLIDAREADVDIVQWDTMDQAQRYAEETVSSTLYLAMECTGVRDDQADVVASHAGVGIGLVTNLRAAPHRILQGEVPLPVELLPPSFPYGALNDIAEDPMGYREILPQVDQYEWEEGIRQMALAASGHLTKAQSLQQQVPKAGKAALLPMIPALHYLSILEQPDVNYNVFDIKLHGDRRERLRVLMYLTRSWLTGVY